MTEQVFLVPPPFGGVRADLSHTAIPLDSLRYSRNWIAMDGKIRVRPGFTPVGQEIGEPAHALVEVNKTDGTVILVAMTGTAWYRFNPVSMQWMRIIHHPNSLTAPPFGHGVFREFVSGGVTRLLGANGVDPLHAWNLDVNFAAEPVPAAPIARCLLTLGRRVIALHTLSGTPTSPIGYNVSALADHTSGWNNVQYGHLADTPGEIVAALEFNNESAAIYKTDAIYLARVASGRYPFTFSLKSAGVVGPASRRAVVQTFDGAHVYLSQNGDLIRFDGVAPVSLGSQVRAWIQQYGNLAQLGRAHLAYDSRYNHIWIWYPATGSIYTKRALVIEYERWIQNRVASMWPQFIEYHCSAMVTANLQDARTLGGVGDATLGVMGGLTLSDFTYPQVSLISILDDEYSGLEKPIGGGAPLPISIYGTMHTLGNDTIATEVVDHELETGMLDMGPGWKTLKWLECLFERSISTYTTVSVGVSNFGESRVHGEPMIMPMDPSVRSIVDLRTTGRWFCFRLLGRTSNLLQLNGAAIGYVERGKR